MRRLSECLVLSSLSNIKMPCERFCGVVPSYRGGGCLIAHTLLALKEFEIIKNRALSILSKLVMRTLRSSYIYANIVKELGDTYLKKYLDFLLRYAIVMHDLGKLSRYYINGTVKSYRHEIVSWLYMLMIKDQFIKISINNLEPFGINVRSFKNLFNLLSKLYDYASLAVLLHHESFLWREAEEERLDIVQEAQGLLARYGSRQFMRYLELDNNLINTFIKGIELVNGILKLIPASVMRVLEEIPKLTPRIKEELSKYIGRAQVRDKKLINMRVALLMYYLLFMVDNRAASAREGLNNYWLRTYKEVIKRISNYEILTKLLITKLKGNAFHVSLTLVPNLSIID